MKEVRLAGKVLNEELGAKKLTTKALGKFMSSMMASHGVEAETKEGPKSRTRTGFLEFR